MIFNILYDPAGATISAAILVDRAINAKIPPSALLIPKVSKSQNKCQKLLWLKSPRAYRPDPGLRSYSIVKRGIAVRFFEFC